MSFDTIRARDLMTKNVVKAKPDESLRTAITRMKEHAIHGLLVDPIAPGGGHSILTGKDCIEVVCDAGAEALDDLRVEDAMTRPAVAIQGGLCVTDAIRLMRHAGVRTVPVVEGDDVVGILTFTDVLRACSHS